uniref:Uncharacterized protein n=1 Tax=Glossina morsitans morsitans TaxID=37546 RepID=A0A1B0FMZ5_GLOMM
MYLKVITKVKRDSHYDEIPRKAIYSEKSGDFKLREIKKRNKIINNKRKIREKKVFNNKSGKSERPELKVKKFIETFTSFSV